jgi:hypothetical protein
MDTDPITRAITQVINAIIDLLPRFQQSYDEPDRIRTLEEGIPSLERIRDDLNKRGSLDKVDQDQKLRVVFQIAQLITDLHSRLDDISNTLDFASDDVNAVMSDTFVRETEKMVTAVIAQTALARKPSALDIILPQLVEATQLKKDQFEETHTLYGKYAIPELLVALLQPHSDEPEAQAIIANELNSSALIEDAFALPTDLIETNLLQMYGYHPTPNTKWDKLEAHIKQAGARGTSLVPLLNQLSQTAPVILLTWNTNYIYDFDKLRDLPDRKLGVSMDIIDKTDSIHLTSPSKAKAQLYIGGKASDLTKARKMYSRVASPARVFAFETYDGKMWQSINLNPQVVVGPNPRVAALNKAVEESILSFHQPPVEITWIETPPRLAEIRLEVTRQIMERYKKLGSKSVRSVGEFLGDPLIDIYIASMMQQFNRLSKNLNPLVVRESRLSYLADVNTSSKQFRREVGEQWKASQSPDDVEKIVKASLDTALKEQSNMYRAIDEKQSLFTVYKNRD